MDSALITVTQGDFLYLDEWIQYHYNIGFKLICIAYNGDCKDFYKLPKYDYVKYFDFSTNDNIELFTEFDGRKSKIGWVGLWHHSANILLKYIKSFFKDYIKYVGIIDTDEFIYPTEKFNNITEYLDIIYNQNLSSEYIHMQFYNGNGKIFYEDKPVLKRFTTASNQSPIGDNCYDFKKTIINLHNNNIDNLEIGYFHDTNYSDNNNNLDFEKIVLKHFFCKSLEEWIMKMNPKNDKDYFNRFKGHIFSDPWTGYFMGALLNNKITEDAIKAISFLLKRHHIDYKPEIEEENEEFRNIYKKINNLE